MNSNRRDFIKKTCGVCASVVGISILAPAVQSCSTLTYVQPPISQGRLSVPIASFVEKSANYRRSKQPGFYSVYFHCNGRLAVFDVAR